MYVFPPLLFRTLFSTTECTLYSKSVVEYAFSPTFHLSLFLLPLLPSRTIIPDLLLSLLLKT